MWRGIFQYGHPPVLRPVCLFTKVSSLAQPSFPPSLPSPNPSLTFHIRNQPSSPIKNPFSLVSNAASAFWICNDFVLFVHILCVYKRFILWRILRQIDCILCDKVKENKLQQFFASWSNLSEMLSDYSQLYLPIVSKYFCIRQNLTFIVH